MVSPEGTILSATLMRTDGCGGDRRRVMHEGLGGSV